MGVHRTRRWANEIGLAATHSLSNGYLQCHCNLLQAIIFGGSLSRAVGTLVLDAVPQEWMPLTTAAIYLPVSLLGLLFLHRAHGPSSTDISNKSARRPMMGAERGQFLRRFAPGIILMLLAYVQVVHYYDYDRATLHEWR
jgi:hypothetical protein